MSEETDNENGKRRGPTPRASAQIKPEVNLEGVLVWLIDLFEEGHPQRVALHAVFGPQGKRKGPLIKEFAFKATDDPNHEDLVELTNKIERLAQEQCEVFGKKSNYGVFAYDTLRSSDFYDSKAFNLRPKHDSQQLAEERGETLYDDDEEGGGNISTKLLLQILDGERRDKRWMMELAMNVLSGAAQRDAERIHSLEEGMDGIYDRSVKYIAATEAMLNQAADRKARADRSEMVNEALREGIDMLKKTLVPAVAVYLSKGKVGVVQRLREILDELAEDTKRRLFGDGGVFDEDQSRIVLAIADGDEDPRRLIEFVQSIRPEQAQTVMQEELLSMQQIQSLQALAKAVSDVVEREQAEEAKRAAANGTNNEAS